MLDFRIEYSSSKHKKKKEIQMNQLGALKRLSTRAVFLELRNKDRILT